MNADASPTASQRLSAPLQYLKGVGQRRAELLARLNLASVCDLLFFFPRDYETMGPPGPIAQLREGQQASVCGVVAEVDSRTAETGRSVVGVLVGDGDDYVRALWFNQPHRRRQFAVGQRLLLSGCCRKFGGRWEITHPLVELLEGDEPAPTSRIFPVYSLTEGVTQAQMRRMVHQAVESHGACLEEVFPESFLGERQLLPIQLSLREIHAPTSPQRLEHARRRFIYEELLVLQLALALRREAHLHTRRAPRLLATARIDARIKRLFPFELTGDQQQAIRELAADMAGPAPMNRLLQGEVGSGKTVVAQYAMLLAVAHQHQAVLMAPTEVLAQQHAETLLRDLRQSRVRIALLTGSLSAPRRRQLRRQIAAGEIDLVVGTHAVVHEDVQFARLGLAIVDEQHKFGVDQRARLRRAGSDPHYLVMTATPIPRTISMTLFGDLEVSTLRQTPPGRQQVHTYLAEPERRNQWWDFYRRKLREGRQGYVITPLVDESDRWDLASVEQAFEDLANGQLEAFRLGLIHGRMSPAAKEAAMQAFRGGDTQVLLATSVVEVGVNVPNATLMTIESGERFGLAQLHQLRGRVSRGAYPGFVCVFAAPQTGDAAQRLQAFCRSNDGFHLAEVDFQLRGPGDLFGTRQHGLPPLRIADLLRDAAILEEARCDARALISAHPQWRGPAFARLRRMVIARYGRALELGDVG